MSNSAANVVFLHAGELWLLLKHGTWRRMFRNVLVMSVRKNEHSVPSPELPRGRGMGWRGGEGERSRPGAEVSPFPGVQKLFSRLRKRWPVWPPCCCLPHTSGSRTLPFISPVNGTQDAVVVHQWKKTTYTQQRNSSFSLDCN